MFIHNFKYTLKTLFKDRMLIFWTFAFPIILATFFNMAFCDIEKNEKLDIINIAIVNNDLYNTNNIYKESFKNLSDQKNKDRLFNIKYTSLKQAKELLKNSKITGYLILEDDNPKVVVATSGINETVFKYVTEEISQTKEIMNNIANKKIEEYIKTTPKEESGDFTSLYAKIYENVLKMTKEKKANIKNISNSKLSYTMIEFYTLIAMACLYGGILSMVAINKNLANMSSKGKRISISKIPKSKLILSSLLASYMTQLIGLFLLFIYTIFILNVDYGDNLFSIIILTLIGSFAGLSLGTFTASVFKVGENTKMGIILSITMLGCFFSGMMGITMKYIIDKNIPLINKVNPASMITDGFYSLYYYDTMDRFYFNIISLILFSLILITLSIFSLRRQKYDSI